jgi:ankyrin repeat protein
MARHVEDVDSGEEERGAHLRLAQRHHKIQAGSFRGSRTFEHEFPHPGRVGQVAICFTTTGVLGKESRLTCQLPPHGWSMPDTPTVVLRLLESGTCLPLKATWSTSSRVLELTTPTDRSIPSGTSVAVLVSGVSTPEHATPQAELTVTAFEKLVVRNTVPASTRGGQIVDGPDAFTLSKIVPGQIGGTTRWQPFTCCPSAVSNVSISFTIGGQVPIGGKIRIELPNNGWGMDDSPIVKVAASGAALPATWDSDQHVLEVALIDRIGINSSVTLTIERVKNPDNETMHIGPGSSASAGRLTTLSPSGGVIDGPSKIEIAPISQLHDRDFNLIASEFDKEQAINGQAGVISISALPDLLRRAGLKLSDEMYQRLVVGALPPRFALETPRVEQDNGEASEASQQQVNAPSSEPTDGEPLEPSKEWILKQEVLTVFAGVYAPAYKYGQELRLACGRGQIEQADELLSRGCDPSGADGSGWSALHYAAEYGQLAVIDLLASSPPSTSTESESSEVSSPPLLAVNTRDAFGWTALLCAAANGHTSVVDRLLSLGADLALTTADGRTALHWACIRGMTDTSSALIAAGADVHARDRSGWTPLHCAHLHGNTACASALLDHGANVEDKDKLQYTASDYSGALSACG